MPGVRTNRSHAGPTIVPTVFLLRWVINRARAANIVAHDEWLGDLAGCGGRDTFPLESKGVVEVWGCSGIPGTVSQRTRFEIAHLAGEVGDDHSRISLGMQ